MIGVCFAITLALVATPPRLPQNGLAWDFIMALGYVATALFLVIPLVSTRVWFALGGEAEEVRPVLGFHRALSYLALVYLLAHVAGAIVIDSTVIEYLKPSAPWGMIAALVSSVMVIVVMLQSEYRVGIRMPYRRWYVWHCVLSVIIILGMFYHIVEAGYFTYSVIEKVVLALLAVLASLLIFRQPKRYRPTDSRQSLDFERARMPAWRAAAYASLVAMILLFVDSIPGNGNRAEKQHLQCLIEDC